LSGEDLGGIYQTFPHLCRILITPEYRPDENLVMLERGLTYLCRYFYHEIIAGTMEQIMSFNFFALLRLLLWDCTPGLCHWH